MNQEKRLVTVPRFKLILSTVALLLAALSAPMALAESEIRSFTVKDSFNRTQLVELNHEGNRLSPFLFSSDGKRVFMVTATGDAEALTYRFKLLMFNTGDILQYIKSRTEHPPEPITLMETRFNQQTLQGSDIADNRGIKLLTLTKNPDELALVAADSNGIQQLFRVNAATRSIEKITSMQRHVTDFVILDKRDEILFAVGDTSREDEHCSKPSYSLWKLPYMSTICFEGGESLQDIMNKEKLMYPGWGPAKLYKVAFRAGADPILLAENLWFNFQLRPNYSGVGAAHTVIPSPSETKALLRTFSDGPPASFKSAYEQSAVSKFFHPGIDDTEYGHVANNERYYSFYTLIDLENNFLKPHPVLPIVPHFHDYSRGWPSPVWINEESVFVPELFPISATQSISSESSGTAVPGRGTLIDLKRDRYVTNGAPAFEVVAASLKAAAEKNPGKSPNSVAGQAGTIHDCVELPLDETKSTPIGCYADHIKSELRLFTGEDAQTLPNVHAKDLRTGKTKLLLELKPQFDKASFAQIKRFATTDEDGESVEVVAFLPPNYDTRRRYPVVVDTNKMTNDRFVFDGPSFLTAPSATQALANKNMIVMFIKKKRRGGDGPLNFRSYFAQSARAIDAGLRLLDGKGMIDLSKIGMIGYSALGRFVMDMALHPKYPIEAFIVADAHSTSFLSYLSFQHRPSAEGLFRMLDDEHCGAKPWGDRRDEWLQRNPYFNLDKLSSAALFTQNWTGLSVWLDIIYGLERLKKPVDAYAFRSYQHPPVEAYSVITQQELTVDWFDFWLNGAESTDPKKEEQYTKWRTLRELKRALPAQAESSRPLSKMDCSEVS